jgi:hypothetical protein
MSKRTWASQTGLDYDEEQEEIAKEPQMPAPQPMVQPGMPGQMPPGFGKSPVPPDTRTAESFVWENCGTGDGGFKSDNTCAAGGGGAERGATAVFQGDKVRVISKRARINIDQMRDLMGERGYNVGDPQSGPRGTFYPIAKGDGPVQLVPAKAIQKFLTTENLDFFESYWRDDYDARTESLAIRAIDILLSEAKKAS